MTTKVPRAVTAIPDVSRVDSVARVISRALEDLDAGRTREALVHVTDIVYLGFRDDQPNRRLLTKLLFLGLLGMHSHVSIPDRIKPLLASRQTMAEAVRKKREALGPKVEKMRAQGKTQEQIARALSRELKRKVSRKEVRGILGSA